MTDTGNVYRKLQGRTQLGKYRFRQNDNINTEPGVSDSTTAQVSPMLGFCVSSLFTSLVQRFSEKLGATSKFLVPPEW